MTWHELFTALERADPASEIVVVVPPAGGTRGVRPGGGAGYRGVCAPGDL